jgi:putative ABC transport system permease protein
MRSLLLLGMALLTAALAMATGRAQEAPIPDVLVSRQLAEEAGLEAGDLVRLSASADGSNARAFRVLALYEPVADPMELGNVRREMRLHLPDLLEFTRAPDVPAGAEYVASVNVALTDPAEAGAFANDVAARMPGVFATPAEGGGRSNAPFVVLERFHLAIALVTIIAATVFLLALTIMLVDERRETVGVLRLIGLPSRRILAMVLVEGLIVAGAGAVFGLALALASEDLINLYFQRRYDTTLVFVSITPAVAATCVAIAVPLGAAATLAASYALLRRDGLRLARR